MLLHATGPAPRNWVTRSGEFQQDVTVMDELETLRDYRVSWVSWSPCYSNGVFLNDHLLWVRNDDCYVFATHEPAFEGQALDCLTPGENISRTALAPLMRGRVVHGMEVQWPGFQVKSRHGWR